MERDPGIDRLFDRAAREIDPPVAVLVAESHRLGRRRRLHRRLRITAAALTVAALATTTAVTQWPARDSGSTLTVAADPTPSSPTPSASASASVSASPKASPATTVVPPPVPGKTDEPTVPVSAEAMFRILADLLPKGAKFSYFDDPLWPAGGNSSKHVNFYVDYDDGHGASTVGVTLESSAAMLPAFGCDGFSAQGDTARPTGALPASCGARILVDGSRIQSVVTATGASGQYGLNVHVRRPDGVVVRITAGTGTISGQGSGIAGTEVTRLVPPIGLAVLESMVLDPRWQFQVPKRTWADGKDLAGLTGRIPPR
ncbi:MULTISPECIES: hypothetical protein [unclassified Kitasatospora]|uniref:hypothetical protein n=1 Tax=unclassified Kitasatospora TaxID=2633591 RepID=UPI00070BA633|nr:MULTISPECIES: hypothetical protein [unclassified Kitasatospora]KQV14407.1 hypothetical protein ASC99_31720 [Kitasatospora sp. Root107]KRB66235.1 hypothetical protein ASE03_30935 [Kitasatospora sp. Root187]